MKNTIAVYGSLKKNAYNHAVFLENQTLIGKSTINGSMYLISDAYPGLLKPEDTPIGIPVQDHEIELYDVDDMTFTVISQMEKGAGYTEELRAFMDEHGVEKKATIFWASASQKDPDSQKKWLTSYTKETVPQAFR